MSLELRGLVKRFGGVTAVNEVDLAIPERAILGLIGPNGAGKTTLINLISGHLRADAGTVSFDGRDITGLPAYRCTALGIARTFQGVRLFRGLTVAENVRIGRHARVPSDVLAALLPRRARREADDPTVGALLERVGLRARARDLAGELSHGEQRRLELARALAAEPRLLILDEPAAGLNATESAALRSLMRALVDEGLTIVLIEHNVRLVMGTCERVVVLNFGRKIAEGAPDEIQADPSVREAYLGADADVA